MKTADAQFKAQVAAGVGAQDVGTGQRSQSAGRQGRETDRRAAGGIPGGYGAR
jgi:hypothetical protein